jgi:hypothetical protein
MAVEKIKLKLSATPSTPAPAATETATEPEKTETTTETETVTETEPAADDAEETPETATEAEAKTVTTTPGARTLADFRSAFGHEQGSVFFADQVPFVDACVKHMTAQAATITAQATEITALKKTGTELAAKLKGEDEPVVTGQHGNGSGSGADPISSFAASAEQRMNKGK